MFSRLNPYLFWIKAGAIVALLAAVWGWGYYTKALACEAASAAHDALDQIEAAKSAKALADATQAVLDAERAHAARLAEIAEQHEQDKRDAQNAQDRLVADLRAGAVRLQNRWRGCLATAEAIAAGAPEPDAAAADREASAGRIVRAARDADDWIKRLQDIIRVDREGQGDKPVR